MDVLDTMATYVRVIEAGSFSAAAKQLRRSAAAVSRQIATLEAEIGALLIRRSTRRMAVTDAGHRYYERCLRILRDVDDAQASARGGLAGVLKVSAPVTFGLETLVGPIRTLMAKHPELHIDLRLEDRMVDLLLDGIDVAIRIRTDPPESTDIVAHRLMTFRRVLVASPAYLKSHGVPATVEALARHEALTHGVDSDTWTLITEGREARVPLHIVFRSNAGHAILELAVAGAGVALLPDWFVADHVRARRLRVVLPAWSSSPATVHALHRVAHRGELRVRTLLDHLREAWAIYARR